MTCEKNHINYWSSCENINTKKSSAARINIILCVCILLSGLRLHRIKVNSVLVCSSCIQKLEIVLLEFVVIYITIIGDVLSNEGQVHI